MKIKAQVSTQNRQLGGFVDVYDDKIASLQNINRRLAADRFHHAASHIALGGSGLVRELHNRSLCSLKSKFKNQNAKFWYSDEVGMILKFYIVILHFDICIFAFILDRLSPFPR